MADLFWLEIATVAGICWMLVAWFNWRIKREE
ncbi:hypothetical protein CLV97_12447 [Planifilum fimeticola]|jgi:hypothetical protein|uniref:Uncharacterized protein n=1 Tax=Planifilum fimeticola TaxID=201975 RepID=A0A2T0LC75_9BACL|nr:hypothetical protein CLV97_12447 [Planifilum fimeticola]